MPPRGGDEITLTPKALVALMFAIMGANVGQAWWTQSRTEQEVVRPDPFTGAMGRDLEDRLNRRIDGLEKRIDAHRTQIDMLADQIHRSQ